MSEYHVLFYSLVIKFFLFLISNICVMILAIETIEKKSIRTKQTQ